MKTVAFLNRKGGVGKTTSTASLAYPLARRGLRVLLVDADPQASLSQGVLGKAEAKGLPAAATLAAVFDGSDPFPEDLVRPTTLEGIDLLPGSDAADPFNRATPYDAPPEAQAALATALGELGDRYDLALIDCPPTLGLLSWASLVAADGLVVPVTPEDYGSQNLDTVAVAFGRVRSGPNPRVRMLGYLLTKVKRLTVHAGYEQVLRELYGSEVFDARIPDAKDFIEAIPHGLPVGAYKPRSAAAKAVAAAADELVGRLDAAHVPSAVTPPTSAESEAA